jgi:hypothetical protein
MKTALSKEKALEILHQEANALADAATGRLDVPISTCPGWFMVDLMAHTGGVHRAQAAIVRSRAREPMGITREMFESVPGLLQWLLSSLTSEYVEDLGYGHVGHPQVDGLADARRARIPLAKRACPRT